VVESAASPNGFRTRSKLVPQNRWFKGVQWARGKLASVEFWNPVFVVCRASVDTTRVRLTDQLRWRPSGIGGQAPPQVQSPRSWWRGAQHYSVVIGASAIRPPTSRTEVLNPAGGAPPSAGFAFQITTRSKPTQRRSKSPIRDDEQRKPLVVQEGLTGRHCRRRR
jgi:hypothetical protein